MLHLSELLTKSQGDMVYLLILGRNLFTSEGNLRGGLGSGPFMITPTRCCGNGNPHVRPHPGLANLEFGRVYLYFCWDTLCLSSGEKLWV